MENLGAHGLPPDPLAWSVVDGELVKRALRRDPPPRRLIPAPFGHTDAYYTVRASPLPPRLSWRLGWRILGGNRPPSTSPPPEASHTTPGAHLLVGWVEMHVCVSVCAYLVMYMMSWFGFFPALRGVVHASTCASPPSWMPGHVNVNKRGLNV